MNFLFDVNNSNFFKTFSCFAVFFGFFAGVAFLGSKNSYLKIFNTLLLILNIFAFAYIIMLVFYPISRIMLYFAGVSVFKDIVHIVMWFAFFLLILAFLNKGFKERSKLFNFILL